MNSLQCFDESRVRARRLNPRRELTLWRMRLPPLCHLGMIRVHPRTLCLRFEWHLFLVLKVATHRFLDGLSANPNPQPVPITGLNNHDDIASGVHDWAT